MESPRKKTPRSLDIAQNKLATAARNKGDGVDAIRESFPSILLPLSYWTMS